MKGDKYRIRGVSKMHVPRLRRAFNKLFYSSHNKLFIRECDSVQMDGAQDSAFGNVVPVGFSLEPATRRSNRKRSAPHLKPQLCSL